MASSTRTTNSGLTADQSLRWTAADNASLSGQQREPVEDVKYSKNCMADKQQRAEDTFE